MRGVKRWFRLRRVERDVDEEIAFHFAELVRDLERGGSSPQQARQEAARQFGDRDRYRRELMSIDRGAAARERRWRRVEAARDTVKYGLRGVVRSWGLSLGVVLAFALGIGANATMYETVERLLLRPPPHIAEPDDVRRLLVSRRSGGGTGELHHTTHVTFPDFGDFARTSAFSAVAAQSAREVTVGDGDAAEQVRLVSVTANYWDLLGVQPALGRFFTVEDDRFGAAPVVVLGWSRWQRDHAGAADVLGSTIDFGYGPYTVVGVAPRGFTGIDLMPVGMFAPFMVANEHLNGGRDWADERGWYFLEVVARLAPGATVAAAEAEATTHHRAGRADTQNYDREASVLAAPLLVARGPNVPSEVAVARWLLGVAVVVLLIACLNVANLLLARMIRNRREIAIRLALGISRGRLAAQIVAEGVILGVLGGVAALLLAMWGGRIVQSTLLPDMDWSRGTSPTVLTLVLLLSLAAGALSALVPAIQATRRDVAAGLRSAAGGITRSAARTRTALTVVQAALSVLLLVGAGLFVRSLDRVHHADFGLDLWQVAYVAPVFHRGTTEAEERWQLHEQAVERVARLPGVESASMTSGVPFWSSYAHRVRAQDVDSIPARPTGGPYAHAVDAPYFRTLGVKVLRGRTFDARDTRHSQRVVVVSELFASTLWPGEDALGKCLYIGADDPPCSEIIGVVADARRGGLVEELPFQYYMPLVQRQAVRAPEALLVRVPANMAQTLSAVQRELLAVDPRIRFVRTMPLEQMVAGDLRQWRLGATMFSLFGLLSLLVAAVGLYSVLAFDVAQRIREIGLRTALGATRHAIMRLVLGRALRITAAGVALGVLLAVALAPRLRDMLYDVSPRDPLTLFVVAATLLVVSVASAWVPAWRAARVDPNVALRSD